MHLDFTTIDITTERDWKETLPGWEYRFDDPDEVKRLRTLISRLQTIVGFGRGFWSGKPAYMYLTYHQDTKRYYWFLRDQESDHGVFFYEINRDAGIFSLLDTLPIEENFFEFDKELDFKTLYRLSLGDASNLPEQMTPVSLGDVFGEDSPILREALMSFRPGSAGSRYPHSEFHRRFFIPIALKRLQKQVEKYNEGSFHVFEHKGMLRIRLGEEEFDLVRKKP